MTRAPDSRGGGHSPTRFETTPSRGRPPVTNATRRQGLSLYLLSRGDPTVSSTTESEAKLRALREVVAAIVSVVEVATKTLPTRDPRRTWTVTVWRRLLSTDVSLLTVVGSRRSCKKVTLFFFRWRVCVTLKISDYNCSVSTMNCDLPGPLYPSTVVPDETPEPYRLGLTHVTTVYQRGRPPQANRPSLATTTWARVVWLILTTTGKDDCTSHETPLSLKRSKWLLRSDSCSPYLCSNVVVMVTPIVWRILDGLRKKGNKIRKYKTN